ncbi:hypothetical protein UO65_0773 [Actinokineospora spheciospongiae]|uniref:Immunity protein Imm1 n=1 Tax=Actinokineospora spheciospongiae TaxID=909613 RepID=W7IU94_9PSEU|nr:Imm1 family immunity protein [Actinokineospora spheciospongiae]EWC63943.1 hypothetical protein UO65_0773 [Actinokineospora spheciospongiae]PWW50827.1 immunity protein Imm1 of predicted polymorphic toxin system [Actinokineospora spheciospongiae]
MTTPLTHNPFLFFAMIPPGVDLVAQVRELNDAGVEIPWAWSLSRERIDLRNREQGVLTFGVNNTVGVLEWGLSAAAYVPTIGTNDEWSGYYLAGMDETNIPPYAEVPVDTVYAAVAEFLTTGERPTCVQWKEAASLLSQFE